MKWSLSPREEDYRKAFFFLPDNILCNTPDPVTGMSSHFNRFLQICAQNVNCDMRNISFSPVLHFLVSPSQHAQHSYPRPSSSFLSLSSVLRSCILFRPCSHGSERVQVLLAFLVPKHIWVRVNAVIYLLLLLIFKHPFSIYLFIQNREKKTRQMDRDFPLAGSFSSCPHQPQLNQAGSLELNLGLPPRCQVSGPKYC